MTVARTCRNPLRPSASRGSLDQRESLCRCPTSVAGHIHGVIFDMSMPDISSVCGAVWLGLPAGSISMSRIGRPWDWEMRLAFASSISVFDCGVSGVAVGASDGVGELTSRPRGILPLVLLMRSGLQQGKTRAANKNPRLYLNTLLMDAPARLTPGFREKLQKPGYHTNLGFSVMSCFIFMSHESPPQQQHPSFAAWSFASLHLYIAVAFAAIHHHKRLSLFLLIRLRSVLRKQFLKEPVRVNADPKQSL